MVIDKQNKKLLNIIIIFLILIIPMGLSGYLRVQPVYLPLLEEQARENVLSFYSNQISENVENSYAYLPPERRNEIVQREMQLFIQENSEMVKQQIKETSDAIKSNFKNEKNNTYLLAIDPWMQYQYARNYVDTGTHGNKLIDGKPVNTLRSGRFEHRDSFRFHPWLMSKFHKFLSFFDRDIDLMKSVLLFPLVLSVLSIIPAFFATRRLSNNLGAFIAAIIIAVHPSILSRTIAGFSDTDVYILFFPLFIFWFIVEAYSTNKDKLRYLYGSLAGLSTGVYAMAWTGWWYIFNFILLSLIAFIIYKKIKFIINFNSEKIKKKEHGKKVKCSYLIKEIFEKIKKEFSIFGVYIISSGIFITFLVGITSQNLKGAFFRLINGFLMPLNFLRYQEVGITTIWPNVLTTVAELKTASITSVINNIGSPFLFFLVLAGIYFVSIEKKVLKTDKYLIIVSLVFSILLMMLKDTISNVYVFLIFLSVPIIIIGLWSLNNKTNLKIKYSVLLLIFITGTFLASTHGIRFVALLIPFASISIGVASGKIHEILKDWLSKTLDINKILVSSVLVILILFPILPQPIKNGWNQANYQMPSYNDAWDETLKIVNQSSEDAIITSWWDFGHWFVAGSERRVTFDGGGQGRRIHWVGKSLLTSNETEAISILRMLNCGQEKPTELLEKYFDEYKSVKILYELIEVNDKDKAIEVLSREGLTEENISELIGYTYCDDIIDQYMIASKDMIGKSGVWGHFGIWDFDRAYMFNKVKSLSMRDGIAVLEDEFGYSSTEAQKLYTDIRNADGDRWISGWPSFMSEEGRCLEVNDSNISCGTGIVLDKEKEEVYLNTQRGLVYPKIFAYMHDGNFKVIEYENGEDVGAIIYPRGNGYGSILMHPAHTASMFTRMYFFNGAGLEKFEQVSYKRGIDGIEIYLYKVNLNETG